MYVYQEDQDQNIYVTISVPTTSLSTPQCISATLILNTFHLSDHILQKCILSVCTLLLIGNN